MTHTSSPLAPYGRHRDAAAGEDGRRPLSDGPAYRLRGFRAAQGGRVVLDIPALDLPAERVTAIVGPNGAGKTSLLRVLAFLACPSAGVVEFRGCPVSFREPALRAYRRQVTLVAHAPLLFRRSVRANITYGLRARRLAAKERVEAALAAVGLAGFAERPAWKLSGGESQRVAIARALAIDPPVYLFDELTANVDRQHVPVVESLMSRLGAAGKTVILTTHNVAQAYRVSDTIVSLVGGRLAPFPLVNLLRGTTARQDGANYFLSGALRIEIPDAFAPRTVAIDPTAIIVSLAPLHSSARNCFPGHICKVEQDARGVVMTVDCGQPLMARITHHSYREMALNVGTRVYVTFKSSAIHRADPEEAGAATPDVRCP
ncbi:MAG: ATP-binding cassette domain-containing protein [Candidatus Binatia bacterium]